MSHVWLFLLTSITITVMPGPDNLQMIVRGVSQGRKAGPTVVAGFVSGCPSHTTLTVFRLAAVLQSSPVALQAIRWLGAVYLVWLGIQALCSEGGGLGHARPQVTLGLRQVYRQNVFANLLNPKVTLFLVTLLPQFADAHVGHVALRMLPLDGVFMVRTIAAFSMYGWCTVALGGWMRRTSCASLWLDCLSGRIFIGLGLRVALTK